MDPSPDPGGVSPSVGVSYGQSNRVPSFPSEPDVVLPVLGIPARGTDPPKDIISSILRSPQ
jgi:hypothetical protein